MASTDLFFTTRGDLESVADAIRQKGGTVADLTYPDGFVTAIGNISGGGGGTINNQNKSVTPTESEQSVTYDSGYTGLGTVTVGAISSTYVGSGIARESSADLTVSGNTITAPAGYYESNASQSVAAGSAGTPTATKGTVSNHSISVTPSVTNTTGYITGGTKTGTAVSVSASELVSGNKSITSNGTNIDVANYSTVSVSVSGGTPVLETITKSYTPTESAQTDTITADAGYDAIEEVDITVNAISPTYVGSGISRKSSSDLTSSGATVTAPAGYYSVSASKSVELGSAGTPIATKSAVSNHSVSITPSVVNTTGYITGGTKTGTAVTVSASELVSGSQTITSNQTVDTTNLAEVIVNVSGGSSKNIQVYSGYASRTANSYGATAVTLTVAKTGTYKVTWMAWRSSSSGTMGTNLHKNSTSGTNQQTFTNTYGQCITLNNQSYQQGDVLTLYATSGSNSRTINVGNLIIEEQ